MSNHVIHYLHRGRTLQLWVIMLFTVYTWGEPCNNGNCNSLPSHGELCNYNESCHSHLHRGRTLHYSLVTQGENPALFTGYTGENSAVMSNYVIYWYTGGEPCNYEQWCNSLATRGNERFCANLVLLIVSLYFLQLLRVLSKCLHLTPPKSLSHLNTTGHSIKPGKL